MKNVIGVRFMPVGPISYYEAGQTKYRMDEKLIINNGNAVDIGQVVIVDKKSNEEGGILSHKTSSASRPKRISSRMKKIARRRKKPLPYARRK